MTVTEPSGTTPLRRSGSQPPSTTLSRTSWCRQPPCSTPVGCTVNVADASYTNTIGDPLLTAFWEDPVFDPKPQRVGAGPHLTGTSTITRS